MSYRPHPRYTWFDDNRRYEGERRDFVDRRPRHYQRWWDGYREHRPSAYAWTKQPHFQDHSQQDPAGQHRSELDSRYSGREAYSTSRFPAASTSWKAVDKFPSYVFQCDSKSAHETNASTEDEPVQVSAKRRPIRVRPQQAPSADQANTASNPPRDEFPDSDPKHDNSKTEQQVTQIGDEKKSLPSKESVGSARSSEEQPNGSTGCVAGKTGEHFEGVMKTENSNESEGKEEHDRANQSSHDKDTPPFHFSEKNETLRSSQIIAATEADSSEVVETDCQSQLTEAEVLKVGDVGDATNVSELRSDNENSESLTRSERVKDDEAVPLKLDAHQSSIDKDLSSASLIVVDDCEDNSAMGGVGKGETVRSINSDSGNTLSQNLIGTEMIIDTDVSCGNSTEILQAEFPSSNAFEVTVCSSDSIGYVISRDPWENNDANEIKNMIDTDIKADPSTVEDIVDTENQEEEESSNTDTSAYLNLNVALQDEINNERVKQFLSTEKIEDPEQFGEIINSSEAPVTEEFLSHVELKSTITTATITHSTSDHGEELLSKSILENPNPDCQNTPGASTIPQHLDVISSNSTMAQPDSSPTSKQHDSLSPSKLDTNLLSSLLQSKSISSTSLQHEIFPSPPKSQPDEYINPGYQTQLCSTSRQKHTSLSNPGTQPELNVSSQIPQYETDTCSELMNNDQSESNRSSPSLLELDACCHGQQSQWHNLNPRPQPECSSRDQHLLQTSSPKAQHELNTSSDALLAESNSFSPRQEAGDDVNQLELEFNKERAQTDLSQYSAGFEKDLNARVSSVSDSNISTPIRQPKGILDSSESQSGLPSCGPGKQPDIDDRPSSSSNLPNACIPGDHPNLKTSKLRPQPGAKKGSARTHLKWNTNKRCHRPTVLAAVSKLLPDSNASSSGPPPHWNSFNDEPCLDSNAPSSPIGLLNSEASPVDQPASKRRSQPFSKRLDQWSQPEVIVSPPGQHLDLNVPVSNMSVSDVGAPDDDRDFVSNFHITSAGNRMSYIATQSSLESGCVKRSQVRDEVIVDPANGSVTHIKRSETVTVHPDAQSFQASFTRARKRRGREACAIEMEWSPKQAKRSLRPRRLRSAQNQADSSERRMPPRKTKGSRALRPRAAKEEPSTLETGPLDAAAEATEQQQPAGDQGVEEMVPVDADSRKRSLAAPSASAAGDEVPRQYEVERIVAKRRRRGKVEYFLKWVGFGDEENSWVPRTKLDCPDLLEAFEATLRTRPRPPRQRAHRPRTAPTAAATTTTTSSQVDEDVPPEENLEPALDETLTNEFQDDDVFMVQATQEDQDSNVPLGEGDGVVIARADKQGAVTVVDAEQCRSLMVVDREMLLSASSVLPTNAALEEASAESVDAATRAASTSLANRDGALVATAPDAQDSQEETLSDSSSDEGGGGAQSGGEASSSSSDHVYVGSRVTEYRMQVRHTALRMAPGDGDAFRHEDAALEDVDGGATHAPPPSPPPFAATNDRSERATSPIVPWPSPSTSTSRMGLAAGDAPPFGSSFGRPLNAEWGVQCEASVPATRRWAWGCQSHSGFSRPPGGGRAAEEDEGETEDGGMEETWRRHMQQHTQSRRCRTRPHHEWPPLQRDERFRTAHFGANTYPCGTSHSQDHPPTRFPENPPNPYYDYPCSSEQPFASTSATAPLPSGDGRLYPSLPGNVFFRCDECRHFFPLRISWERVLCRDHRATQHAGCEDRARPPSTPHSPTLWRPRGHAERERAWQQEWVHEGTHAGLPEPPPVRPRRRPDPRNVDRRPEATPRSHDSQRYWPPPVAPAPAAIGGGDGAWGEAAPMPLRRRFASVPALHRSTSPPRQEPSGAGDAVWEGEELEPLRRRSTPCLCPVCVPPSSAH